MYVLNVIKHFTPIFNPSPFILNCPPAVDAYLACIFLRSFHSFVFVVIIIIIIVIIIVCASFAIPHPSFASFVGEKGFCNARGLAGLSRGACTRPTSCCNAGFILSFILVHLVAERGFQFSTSSHVFRKRVSYPTIADAIVLPFYEFCFKLNTYTYPSNIATALFIPL